MSVRQACRLSPHTRHTFHGLPRWDLGGVRRATAALPALAETRQRASCTAGPGAAYASSTGMTKTRGGDANMAPVLDRRIAGRRLLDQHLRWRAVDLSSDLAASRCVDVWPDWLDLELGSLAPRAAGFGRDRNAGGDWLPLSRAASSHRVPGVRGSGAYPAADE